MYDRFRYRVWDKTQNRWLYFDFSTYPTYQDRIWQALTDGETFYQCTGLKDKNGTLIYEGDIVKETVVDYIDEEFLTVVCWSNLKASYNIDDTIHCEREVIGNIYENKELLNERD